MITEEAAREGLSVFGVDQLGLDSLDLKILDILCVRFAGRPVGLSTLAVSVGEEPETVEDVYEPFLLQAGLIMRTPRGQRRAHQLPTSISGLAVPAQSWSSISAGDPDQPVSTSSRGGVRSGAVQDVLFTAGTGEDAFPEDPGSGD